MSKSLSLADKIEKLGKQKKELIKKRREEILSLIEKHASLTIDDSLLIGCLQFLSNVENINHNIMIELKNYFKANKTKISSPKQQTTT